jgi:hypothetical protein
LSRDGDLHASADENGRQLRRDRIDGAETDSITVNVTISPVNDAPAFTKGADQSAPEDSGEQSVTGWATGLSKGPFDEKRSDPCVHRYKRQ